MMEMVAEGGRMCEGISGCFEADGVGAYGALADGGVAATIRGIISGLEGMGAWEMRDGAVEHAEQDGLEDASHMTLIWAQYRDHLTGSETCGEVNDLAERLGDVKVGLGTEDVQMEDLVEGLDALVA